MPTPHRSLAVFLLAFAGLVAELAWTRLTGLFLYGEAAYLVVTLAVAGLSLGAAIGAWRPKLLAHASAFALAAGLTLAAGTIAALVLAGRGGVVTTILTTLPTFALLGVTFAGLFASNAQHAPRLYASDLIGAALGASLALPLVAWLGAPNVLWLASGVAALAAAAAASARPMWTASISLAAVILVITLIPAAIPAALEPSPSEWGTQKSLPTEQSRGGVVLGSEWGTLGRSDLLMRSDGSTILYLNASAGSIAPTPESTGFWRRDASRLPFLAYSPGSVFVIGAGAGVEVAHALETGANNITAAEVNAAGAQLAEAYLAPMMLADVTVDPFGDSRVTWVFDEARSVLRRSEGNWDLVIASQAVTRTTEARGLALTENGIYTVEALRDILSALAPTGVASFEMYDEATLTRLLFTAATALQEEGLATDDAQALRHVIALLDPSTSPPTPLLIVHKSAPDVQEVINTARVAEARGMALLHLPGLLENPPLDGVMQGSTTFATLVETSEGVNLKPTRDDAPFFWSFEPGLPRIVSRTLLIVLAISLLVSLPLLLMRTQSQEAGIRRGLLAALLLGTSFLAFELAVLSKASLFLGHPAAALSTTLAGLLLGMGFGAAAARSRADSWSATANAAWLAGSAALLWVLAWPFLSDALQGAPSGVRIAVVLTTLVPVGFVLGAPFPLILRRIGSAAQNAPGPVARAWALNGLGSVIAGVGSLALAHLLGFTAVTFVACVLYALTGYVVRITR